MKKEISKEWKISLHLDIINKHCKNWSAESLRVRKAIDSVMTVLPFFLILMFLTKQVK